MKSIFRSLMAIAFAFTALQVNAQGAIANLNNIIDQAKDIKTNVRANRSALKTLTVDYFQNNNPTPNVAAYLAVMQNAQSNIESLQDDIAAEISFAAAANPNIDPANIQAWASQIEAREDFVQNESQALANYIANGQRQDARAAVRAIRGFLAEQIQLANQIIAEANALKQAPLTFNVRVEVLDDQGNPGDYASPYGPQGVWALDVATNQYIYPDPSGASQYGTNIFSNLPAGDYIFGAFDGPFCGASSEAMTLDASSATGTDGFVLVELQGWCE